MKTLCVKLASVMLLCGLMAADNTTVRAAEDHGSSRQATQLDVQSREVAGLYDYTIWYFNNGRWHGDGPYYSAHDAYKVLHAYWNAGFRAYIEYPEFG